MSKVRESFDCENGEKPSESVRPPISWKTAVKEFFVDDSTFSGAFYVFKSKYLGKRIFWAAVLLTAIAGFGVVTALNIRTLVREPVSTSITLTRESELEFPAVTICSLSLLNTTAVQSISDNSNVVKDLELLFYEIQTNKDIAACNGYANGLRFNTGGVGWGDLINLAQNDLSVLLGACTFAGKSCSVNDFEPVSTVGGLCYTFNGPKTIPTRIATGTGVRQGLRLQLSPDNQLFSLGLDHGFRVVIHNRDEPPRPEAEGVVVGLDSAIYIGMRQVNSDDKTLFSSGFKCKNADENTDRELSFPGYHSYSSSSCLNECFYKQAIEQCDCIERQLYTPVGGRYSHLSDCTEQNLCCEVKQYDEVNERCDCPPRCNSVERTFTTSTSTSNLFNSNNRRFVFVNVFYESFILETRETTDSYTPWSLISDIGGNTGLFLGLTLLSGIELLMLVMGLMKDCCCCCCKKPKQGITQID